MHTSSSPATCAAKLCKLASHLPSISSEQGEVGKEAGMCWLCDSQQVVAALWGSEWPEQEE